MKLWVSSEAPREITRPLSKLDIPIEDDLNNYLKSIGYSNEKLTRVRLILIIRNDDFSALGGEYIRKQPREPIINTHLRLDYNEFKNGDETKRKLMIYGAIYKTFNMIENKKKIKNITPYQRVYSRADN
jgi:hypothetical protein